MPIQIFTPKLQLVKYIGFSLIFVAAGILLFTQGSLFVEILAVASFVLGGSLLLSYVPRLVRRTPVIQIDGFGVTDRSSAIALGHLRWDEIAGVRIDTVQIHTHGRSGRQRFLAIRPNPAVDVLARANPFKRFAMRLNRGMGYSSINIAESMLPFSLETLIEQMLRFRPSLVVEPPVATDRSPNG